MSNDPAYKPLTEEVVLTILAAMPRSLTPGDMAKLFAQFLHSYNMIEETPVIFAVTIHVLNHTSDIPDNTIH